MAKAFRFGLDFQVWGDGATDRWSLPSLIVGSLTNGRIMQGNWSIAASATLDLWSSALSPATFELLVLIPDVVTSSRIIAEFTTDKDADIGAEPWTVQLQNGFPFILGSNVSYANYTVNFGGGTLDVIDRIRLKNIGSVTSTGRYYIGN